MDIVLIFIPDNLSDINPVEKQLFGVFAPKNGRNLDAFYVLGASKEENLDNVVGYCTNTDFEINHRNFIIVSYDNERLCLSRVVKDSEELSIENCHVIQYDEASFVESELFLPSESLNRDTTDEIDHFKALAFHTKKYFAPFKRPSTRPAIVNKVVSIFDWISFTCHATRFSKYSSVGQQTSESVTCLKWILSEPLETGGVKLQRGNLMSAIALDIFIGMMAAYLLEDVILQRKKHFFNSTAFKIEELLEFIKYTIKWIMGSPAGLKLNYPLNYIMGNFFLFNIHLWWSFLGFIRPLLEIGCAVLLKLGFLGVAFQIAILADIFSLVTFHLYCIYIYAARLFEFQLRGIISLSKIFLGRKKNPEPDKVDSCPYSTEQLFIGTVCFTVLLFLLPTTLVYYTVFALIRLLFIFLGGVLTRARFLLKIVPIYSTFIWVVYPQLIITTIQIIPVCEPSSVKMVNLIAKPKASSWYETMKKCVPTIVQSPKAVCWREIAEHVATGKLV